MSQERLKISWQHLTQEDADLLSVWRIDAPITVMNLDDGFTVGTGGWWRPGTILDKQVAEASRRRALGGVRRSRQMGGRQGSVERSLLRGGRSAT
ncbi:hypothetical protein [Aurantimonas coralicida]|uniref:hypothetical protein n=1 Tax=Aurantimonas coralicida TaxID=182270 RepID=UPI001D195565|nr:hypothetical protein [Aurantimonas coralicida]MCC4297207.1 hypothetical protein [Aurantimonas coralicida]